MNVVIFGMGYVGITVAACLLKQGHTVVGIEVNEEKRKIIALGRSPTHEPGVDAQLSNGIRDGRLSVIADPQPALSSDVPTHTSASSVRLNYVVVDSVSATGYASATSLWPTFHKLSGVGSGTATVIGENGQFPSQMVGSRTALQMANAIHVYRIDNQ